MTILDKVKQNFNDPSRINEDKENYAPEAGRKPTDPFEAHREDLLHQMIIENQPKSAIDLGCGIGHLCVRLLQHKVDCHGVDVAEGMIEAAKSNLASCSFDSNLVECSDILNYDTSKKYDAVIANGVIWYYEDKAPFIQRMRDLLNPGGKAYIVHRNLLFNMFALNQGTLDLMQTHFTHHLEADEQKNLSSIITGQIPELGDPVKLDGSLKKPYDNPLTIDELYSPFNLKINRVSYTYIHPTPPRFKLSLPDERYAQAQKIYANHWAGAFLGSQFIVEVQLADET